MKKHTFVKSLAAEIGQETANLVAAFTNSVDAVTESTRLLIIKVMHIIANLFKANRDLVYEEKQLHATNVARYINSL